MYENRGIASRNYFRVTTTLSSFDRWPTKPSSDATSTPSSEMNAKARKRAFKTEDTLSRGKVRVESALSLCKNKPRRDVSWIFWQRPEILCTMLFWWTRPSRKTLHPPLSSRQTTKNWVDQNGVSWNHKKKHTKISWHIAYVCEVGAAFSLWPHWFNLYM